MRTMSATISSASGGRPIGLDLFAQNRAKPRRCHAITVAGFTIARTSAQRDQVRESTTQKARSSGRRRGRGADRRRIERCWRSARFSRTRLARGRTAASTAPTIASSTVTIAHKFARFRVFVTGESRPPIGYPAARPCSRSLARSPQRTTYSPAHLTDAVIAWMKTEGVSEIWVAADNDGAVALYRANGFDEPEGMAVYMTREL
jgi:hypothetical protein